jgi:hypothetical protein
MNERWEEAFQRAVLVEGQKIPEGIIVARQANWRTVTGIGRRMFRSGRVFARRSCVVVSCSLSKGCRGNAQDYGQLLPLSSQ